MENSIKKRGVFFDNIKGILIFLVVFAHCIFGLQSKAVNSMIVDYIYYFHMPVFVFVSGYFSKSERCRSIRSTTKLLVAYAFMMIPFMVKAFIDGKEIQAIKPYYSAWYLLAIIAWRMLMPHLAKIKHILPLSVAFSILIGFWPSINGISVFAINKIVTFLPFFVAGYLLQEETVEKNFKSKNASYKVLAGSACLGAATVIIFLSRKYLDADINDLLPYKYREFGIIEPSVRITIFVVSSLMIVAFFMLTIDKSIPILSKIGRNTLPIYVMHRIFTMWYYNADCIKQLRAAYQLLGALAITLVILMVFGSDRFTRLFNTVVDGFTNVFLGSQFKYDKIYKAVAILLLIAILIAPIVQKLTLYLP